MNIQQWMQQITGNQKNYINDIVKFICKEKPSAVITVDTKGFSLELAKNLKNVFENSDFKCPLIHFVPPTIWAYGKSRITKWKNLHDELICLYKIEEDIFKKYNTECIYLGNPIIEKFLNFNQSKNNQNNDNYSSKNTNCLLLPNLLNLPAPANTLNFLICRCHRSLA